MADITLASANDLQFELDSNFGFDLGPGEGIGSQDFDVELGIDFGDGPGVNNADRTLTEDETISVEMGRDAALPRSPRESLGSHLLGKDGVDLDILSNRSREASEHPLDAGLDMDFGGDLGGMDIDLGLDFGDGAIGDSTLDEVNGREQARSPSRACKLYNIYPRNCTF